MFQPFSFKHVCAQFPNIFITTCFTEIKVSAGILLLTASGEEFRNIVAEYTPLPEKTIYQSQL